MERGVGKAGGDLSSRAGGGEAASGALETFNESRHGDAAAAEAQKL